MTLQGDLAETLLGCTDDDARIEAVIELINGKGLHAALDCPECTEPHCEDLAAHYVADLAPEAIQSMHSQAHNGPKDSLYAEHCYREPCASVA